MTTIDTTASGPSVRRRQRPDPISRQVERRAADGTVLGTVDLEPEWFGIEPNTALMHQVVVAQRHEGAERLGLKRGAKGRVR